MKKLSVLLNNEFFQNELPLIYKVTEEGSEFIRRDMDLTIPCEHYNTKNMMVQPAYKPLSLLFHYEKP